MKAVWLWARKIGWPWGAVLAGLMGAAAGGGYADYAMSERNWIVYFGIVPATETRAMRFEKEAKLRSFCDWLETKKNNAWANEAREELGLCGE